MSLAPLDEAVRAALRARRDDRVFLELPVCCVPTGELDAWCAARNDEYLYATSDAGVMVFNRAGLVRHANRAAGRCVAAVIALGAWATVFWWLGLVHRQTSPLARGAVITFELVGDCFFVSAARDFERRWDMLMTALDRAESRKPRNPV